MKKMRRLLAVLMTFVMVMGFATTALAEGTYTLTLNNAQEGHTYTAYQIFAGDLHGDVLSNIVWGSGITEEGKTYLGDAAECVKTITTAAEAEAFATKVAPYLETVAGSATVAEGATSCDITGLAAGYYLVQTTNVTTENGVYTYYIMKIVKDTEANVKADVPEVEKTVNDPDVNIGDEVTFTLTATMPSDIQGYETYKVVFHDTLSEGLTYGNIKSVTIDETEITSGYEVSHEGGILTITFEDVLDLGAEANSVIEVQYTATVNEDAVIGGQGNPNKVYLEYSNNPNAEGTGKTPEKEVKVYTWEIPVFKYTGTDTPLAGAGFKLYKGDVVVDLVEATANEAGVPVYKVCTATDCEHVHIQEVITGITGKFEIEGLETGTYILKETRTPAGYNDVADITVVIDEDGELTINGTSVNEVKVLNQKGATLPSTGGIGTTIFYIVGAILVIGAAVVMITRKRMDA